MGGTWPGPSGMTRRSTPRSSNFSTPISSRRRKSSSRPASSGRGWKPRRAPTGRHSCSPSSAGWPSERCRGTGQPRPRRYPRSMSGARRNTFLIVGGNLTAGAAATTLRSEGFDGRIVIVGEENHPPYERPPLSKDYLRGESKADDTLLHPRSWYDEADVELRLGVRARHL